MVDSIPAGSLVRTGTLLQFDTLLGPDTFAVRTLNGHEAISELFELNLDLVSENLHVQPASLVAEQATVRILSRNKEERQIHGLINRFTLVSTQGPLASYRAQVVPALWFLTCTGGCAIFQNKTVPEIVEVIFQNFGVRNYKFQLTREYKKREYCIQYRETAFDFISRLLEEEGICYFFRHTEKSHSVILADDPSAHPSCEQEVNCELSTGTELNRDAGYLQGWTRTADVQPRKCADGFGSREAVVETLSGQSSYGGFVAGYTFKVKQNSRTDQVGTFLLTGLEYEVEQGGLCARYESERNRYRNHFAAISMNATFRPPCLTSRPFIRGPQTAFVTGPQKDEIYADECGRVKVQFDWDRKGTFDGLNSCWVPVVRSFAGKGSDNLQLPTVGQQVLIEFLDGDPDRPVITGLLHDADRITPHARPDESRTGPTSPDYHLNGDYDEILLDDDCREGVGRDWRLIAGRDKLEHVSRDKHALILRDQIQQITRDNHLTVSGKQAISIGGSQSLCVKGDVIEQFNGFQSTEVAGSCYIKGTNVVVEATTGLTIKVGESFVTINSDGVQIQGPTVLINSGGAALAGTPGNLVAPVSARDAAAADDVQPED